MKHQRQSTRILALLATVVVTFAAVGRIRAADAPAPGVQGLVKDAEFVIVAREAPPTPAAVGTHFVTSLYSLKGSDLPLFHLTGAIDLDRDKTYILFLRLRKAPGGAAEKGVIYAESMAPNPLEATHENLTAVVQMLKAQKSPVLILRVENSMTERDLIVFRLYDDGTFEEFRRPDPERPEAFPKRAGKATPAQGAELAKAVVLAAGQISEPDFVGDPPGHARVNWMDATSEIHALSFQTPHRELLELVEPFLRQHSPTSPVK